MIRDRNPAKKPGMRELKVNIPVKYHLQLHTLKVLEGKPIQGAVEEALNGYFAGLRAAGIRFEA